MKQKGTPQPDKLIKCYGSDTFGDFTVIGKWVLYKKQTKRQNGGRFMLQDSSGNWNAEREVWKDIDEWEYLEP